jgi:hypothetical protein
MRRGDACCARATAGQANAPATSATKDRRFMGHPDSSSFEDAVTIALSCTAMSKMLRCDRDAWLTTGLGLVSRVTPVQTALRNCTGDEGGPFGFGDQVADPKPPQAAAVKSRGGERCGKAGTMIPTGTVERGERKRTVREVSKAV